MKKGFILTNEYLNTEKFLQLLDMISRACDKADIKTEIKTNAELSVTIEKPKLLPDFILSFDKDILLLKHFENFGVRCFNRSKAIEICDDKGLTALTLENSGIKMPKTILAPFTYKNIGYTNLNFLDEVADILKFPLIMKESKGSFGKQVYIINTFQELKEKTIGLSGENIIYEEYIKSSFGRDVRLQTVGKQVVASVMRQGAEGDFRSNVSAGGKMVRYSPDKTFIDMALKAAELTGVDFSGVDIMFGANGEPVFCEINSNAHFKNLYDCTNINVAEYLADYIKEALK